MNQETHKPNFICVGPHKTGTGWLYETLNRHHEVHPIDEKEIRYYTKLDFHHRHPDRVYWKRFKREILWLTRGRFQLFYKYPFIMGRRGDYKKWWECLKFELYFLFWPTSLKWYRNLFDGPAKMIQGDISPSYATLSEHTILEIKKNFPSIKVIFFLRDPVDRIWSHIKMVISMKGLEPNAKNIAKILASHANNKAYQSYPYYCLERWQAVFESKQIFVGFYEELISDPVRYYQRICRFLEIEDNLLKGVQCEISPYRIGQLLRPPQIFESAEQVIHHRWKSSRMNMDIPEVLKETLRAEYQEQVTKLDKLIPNSYPALWLKKYEETTHI